MRTCSGTCSRAWLMHAWTGMHMSTLPLQSMKACTWHKPTVCTPCPPPRPANWRPSAVGLQQANTYWRACTCTSARTHLAVAHLHILQAVGLQQESTHWKAYTSACTHLAVAHLHVLQAVGLQQAEQRVLPTRRPKEGVLREGAVYVAHDDFVDLLLVCGVSK